MLVMLLILFVVGAFIAFITWIVAHNYLTLSVKCMVFWSAFVLNILMAVLLIWVNYFDPKTTKILIIMPSSSLNMFLVSRIAGVDGLTKQEILAICKGHRIYEVHLKK